MTTTQIMLLTILGLSLATALECQYKLRIHKNRVNYIARFKPPTRRFNEHKTTMTLFKAVVVAAFCIISLIVTTL